MARTVSTVTLRITRTLTSADILQLNSVPFELVAAVPGRVYWPKAAFFYYHMGTVAYSNGGATAVGVSTSDGGLMGPRIDIDLIAASQDQIGSAVVGDDSFRSMEYDFAGANVGQPIAVIADADPADGDGTLDVTVEYSWLDVTYFDHLAWDDQPQDAAAFATLPAMTVLAIDNHGDPYPFNGPAVVNIEATAGDPGIESASPYDMVDGVCTLSDVAIENPGTWSLTATIFASPFTGTGESAVSDEFTIS